MIGEVPDWIGDYPIERLIGRGAVAAVYLSHDLSGRPVAVKWLDQVHPALLRRFELEVSTLMGLSHPHIVRYRDHGTWAGRPYLVTDYVDGVDLHLFTHKLFERPPAERYQRCRQIGAQLCLALEALHAAGLVHRDLKPSNVFIDLEGRAVLGDFGIARVIDAPDQTMVGRVVGTVAYAAPEQLEGASLDHRADIYALGATLYYVLTGRRPFDGADRTAAPESVSRFDPGVPMDLESAVLRMMALRPADRPSDAAAASRAIAEGPSAGVRVAGQQQAMDQAGRALSMAATRGRVVLRLDGPPGSGRGGLAEVVRVQGRRAGLEVIEVADESGMAMVEGRWSRDPHILAVTSRSLPWGPGANEVVVKLGRITVADARRTVVGLAPDTAEPARVADRLHRWSGGMPGLMLALIERHTSGGAIVLPEEPALPGLVVEALDQLDMDEAEVLGALALCRPGATADEIEAATMVPTPEALASLSLKGLVTEAEGGWRVPSELVRTGAVERLVDPEGLTQRLIRAGVQIGGDEEEVAAQVEIALNEARDHRQEGRPAAALKACNRAVRLAEAFPDRAPAARARRIEGEVRLELGQIEAARRALADANALARASESEAEGRAAHALRALATLRLRPGSRSAAAAALDRVLPLLAGASERPRDYSDALLISASALSSAALGDGRAFRTAGPSIEARLAGLAPLEVGRVALIMAGGAALVERESVEVWLARVPAGSPLHLWEAAGIRAELAGEPAPEPGALAEGLEPAERTIFGEQRRLLR